MPNNRDTSPEPLKIVLDTNSFVAAGFNPGSSSGKIVEAVRAGRVAIIWNRECRREIEHVLSRIPPLRGKDFSDLFLDAWHYKGAEDVARFSFIPDPDDRKFAALAHAAEVSLVSQDSDLLDYRAESPVPTWSPTGFLERYRSVLERDDDTP
jgi:predicted nucleic acid-binding protein